MESPVKSKTMAAPASIPTPSVSPRPLTDFPEIARNPFPAHCAAYIGNLEVLVSILSVKEFPATFKHFDPSGEGPAHLAARNSQHACLAWLLDQSDFEFVNDTLWLSPLAMGRMSNNLYHMAAIKGDVETTKIIDRYCKDRSLVLTLNAAGYSAFHIAVIHGHELLVEWFCNNYKMEGENLFKNGYISPLHISACQGQYKIVKLLIKNYKYFVNTRDFSGSNAIYYASQEGHLECVKKLLNSSKSDGLYIAGDGMNSVHASAQGGHTNVLKLLVKKYGKRSLFVPTYDGSTVLHYASALGHTDTVKYLLKIDKAKKLLKMPDLEMGTPAHDAAENGHVQVFQLLIEAGSDIMVVDKYGCTPYSLATEIGARNACYEYATKIKERLDQSFIDEPANGRKRIILGNEVKIVRTKESTEYYDVIARKKSLRDTRRSSRNSLTDGLDGGKEKGKFRPFSLPMADKKGQEELADVFTKLHKRKTEGYEIEFPPRPIPQPTKKVTGAGDELKTRLLIQQAGLRTPK